MLASPPGSDERIGLLVDAVTGLVDRAGATVGAGAASATIPPSYVASSVTAGGTSVPVLDLAAVLELPRA